MKAQLTFKVLPGTDIAAMVDGIAAMVDDVAERYAVKADVAVNFHAEGPRDSDMLERFVRQLNPGVEIEWVEKEVPQ